MQKLLLLTILSLVVSTIYCGSGSESSEAKDLKKKQECSGDVIDEIGSSGKPILIEVLFNISITLTGEDKIVFDQFIIELEAFLASGIYTSIELSMYCSFKIKQFFSKYSIFYEKYKYESIGLWGTFDELFQVGTYHSAEKFNGCLVMNSSGKFDIIETFLQFQLKLSNPSVFDVYINELTLILQSTSYTESEKYNLIYKFISKVSTDFPDFKKNLFDLEIGSFGSIYMLQEISIQYYRMEQVEILFEGEPKCAFVTALYSCLTDSKYQLSSSNKGYLKILFDKFSVIIADSTLTYAEKIKAISYQYRQFVKTYGYLEQTFLSFEISAQFGCFGDFLAMFAFGESQQCWPEYFLTLIGTTIELSTTEAAITEVYTTEFSTTELSTTESSTTELSTIEVSTTEGQTTAIITGDCSSASSVVLQVVNGQTIFYTAAMESWSTWAAIEKANWKTFCTKIYNNYVISTTMTETEKITAIIAEINAYVAFYYYREEHIFSIQLGVWGTVRQLCSCKA
uniref:MACPF domain-containing protein n=1 Tax=Strongyloides stercoralis TaxID=6248 RepID=A0A0K0DRY3_STRER